MAKLLAILVGTMLAVAGLNHGLGLPAALAMFPALALIGAWVGHQQRAAALAAALGATSIAMTEGPALWTGALTLLAIGLSAVVPVYVLKRLSLWQPTEHHFETQARQVAAGLALGAPIVATGAAATAWLAQTDPAAAWGHGWLAGALGYAVLAPGVQAWLDRAAQTLPPNAPPPRRSRPTPDGISLGLAALLALAVTLLGAYQPGDLALGLAIMYLPLLLWGTQCPEPPRHALTVAVSATLMALAVHHAVANASTTLPTSWLLTMLVVGPAAMALMVQSLRADRLVAHQRLAQQTRCDVSTGLLTDRGLLSDLAERLADPQRPHLGLIGLHVSNFEALADLCGTLAAVHFEQNTAQRLHAQTGAQCAARLTAGRYALVITAETVAQVRAVAREVYTQLSGQLFATEHTALRLQVCVGGLLIDQQTQIESDDCLGALSDTLGIAASVRDPQLFVEPLSQMMIDARRAQQAKLEHIREAVRESRIELFAQALVDPEAPSGHMSYEVLTRLRDRDGSLMQPPEFLALAVQAQMSVTFDRAVVAQTFEWLARHPEALRRTHRCSINLTGASVCDGAIADFIRTQRARFDLPAERIVFEISEGEALRNPSAVSRLVDDLKAQGFGIALDDFGTGLATFEYLRRFPLDYIKIDGSFIRNLVGSTIDEEIVMSTVRVARRLNLRTIAEHVHTEPVFARLQSLGVEFLQGDLFGRPQPIAALFDHYPDFLRSTGSAPSSALAPAEPDEHRGV